MKLNSSWKKEIDDLYLNISNKKIEFTFEELDKCLNKKIINVNGCLIFSEKNVTISEEQFENIIRIFQDRTGYEASNNELRVIDFVEQDLSIIEQVKFGLIYVKHLNSRLKLMTSKDINYFFGINDGILTIRFHQVWEGENGWIDSLENILEPMAILSSQEI